MVAKVIDDTILLGQQDVEHPFRIHQKVMHDLKVLGVLVVNPANPGIRARIDVSVRIRHQDRRVRGNNKLGFFKRQLVDSTQGRKLPLRG